MLLKKMGKIVVAIACVLLIGGSLQSAGAFTLTFEDGVNGMPVTDIDGVSFKDFNGYDAIYGDSSTGRYATHSDDLNLSYKDAAYHHNGYFWLWAGNHADARGLVVDFTNDDGTWFTTGYSSYGIFQMDAYLTDGTRISVTGESNYSSPMDYLTLCTPENIFIDYVVLMGENGNNWLVDDMSGDTSGIDPDPPATTPEPGTCRLLFLGVTGLLGIIRKARQ